MIYGQWMAREIQEDVVQLTGGPQLAVRTLTGPRRPFLLVHDLGERARCWDAVAGRLNAAGHQVAAVDLRGHGDSQAPDGGYDTDTCADDLSTLMDRLEFTGSRSPVVAGHGWGANVVLSLAARRNGIAAAFCLNGGWIRPSWRYRSFEDYWAAYSARPPRHQDDETVALQQHRQSIVRSLFNGEPRAWYPLINVPVTLCPVVPPDGRPDPSGDSAATRTGVAEATARLPRSRISWYYGEPDVLTTDPGRVSADLLALAATALEQ